MEDRRVRIVIAPGCNLEVEVVGTDSLSRPCSECGSRRRPLDEDYQRLGRELADALYRNAPGGFARGVRERLNEHYGNC